jgi:hypothetical protein
MAGSISYMSHAVSLEGRSSGKRYAEVAIDASMVSTDPGWYQIGITQGNPPAGGQGGLTSDSGGLGWNVEGNIRQSGANLFGFGVARVLVPLDVICIAMDIDAGKAWMAVNNEAWINGGDPDAGTSPTATIAAGTWFIGTCAGGNIAFGPVVVEFVWPVTIRTRADQFTRAVRPASFSQFA